MMIIQQLMVTNGDYNILITNKFNNYQSRMVNGD